MNAETIGGVKAFSEVPVLKKTPAAISRGGFLLHFLKCLMISPQSFLKPIKNVEIAYA